MDILQVAKRARVSSATVSRVLNGSNLVRPATSERVRRAIAELKYVRNPNARSLRLGRTRLFGLIVSDIKNPFFPELIDAFEGPWRERISLLPANWLDLDEAGFHAIQQTPIQKPIRKISMHNIGG